VPLLAFCILIASNLNTHTTPVLTTLLSLGADVSVIPRIFFMPFLSDPPTKAPFDQRYPEFLEQKKAWCKEYMRPILARNVNLTQRYFLEKTLIEKSPSDRQTQVAVMHNALSLLGIGYFMIGQSSAAKMVIQKILSNMALPRSKPLVMVFAGPSGHGKTELAKRMGELLSLEIECIDCTELRYETDLFGPKKPYIGHEAGSPLNNFLARLAGRRCIVFLDEFEKTTRDVQNALLIPFDEGLLCFPLEYIELVRCYTDNFVKVNTSIAATDNQLIAPRPSGLWLPMHSTTQFSISATYIKNKSVIPMTNIITLNS
jgi:hypothetical protein